MKPGSRRFELAGDAEERRLASKRRAEHDADRNVGRRPEEGNRHARLPRHVEQLAEGHERDEFAAVSLEIVIISAKHA
jgi:hypothetical protein